jgi:death-on-curing protein
MEDLTVEKIIEMHDILIDGFGGTPGILSRGTLDFLVYRVNKEKDPIRKAALVLFYVASEHPFIDGNKRTAFVAAENVLGILGQLGMYIDDDENGVVNFMLRVAKYQADVNDIEKWIRERIKKSELA